MKFFFVCTRYLKRCLVESDLLTMSNVNRYEPQSGVAAAALVDGESAQRWWQGDRRMVLDGITLKNLNILPSFGEDAQYSLLATVDHCCTAFGQSSSSLVYLLL